MKRLYSLLALLVIVLSLSAVPARKRTFVHTQSNGEQITLMLVGDENLHYYLNTATQEKMLKGEDGDFYVMSDAQMTTMSQKAEVRRKAMNEARVARLEKNREAGILTSSTTAMANGPRKVGDVSGGMTGSKKGLVILVNFSDKSFASSHTQTVLNNQFNQEGYSDGGHLGSVHDFFYDQSYGQFNLTFDVVGPVTVSNTMSYYGGNDSSGNDKYPAKMVIEALKLVDSQVNFADYDWDGDGEVDQVYVIYAGYGEAYGAASSTIWPHEWQLSSAAYYSDGSGAQTMDGVKIDTYACSCELSGTSGSTLNGIGTACHEFSHCLGYPDFYDTSYAGGFGMNAWDLMDAGSYNGPSGYGEVPCGYTSYERWMAGWLTPTELKDAATINGMKPLFESPKAYIIYNDKNSDEYILLENRQNTKWFKYVDTYTTPHGLLAIHVDYNATNWTNNTPNKDSSHQRMSIIPASGTYGTLKTSGTQKYYSCTQSQLNAHPFSGSGTKTSLTGSSNSSSGGKWFTACSTGSTTLNHEVTEISNASDGTISFLFDGGLKDDGSRYTVTFNAGTGTCTTTSWTQSSFEEKVTLPTATSPSTDWTFLGWSTTDVKDETSTKPTILDAGTQYQPVADVALYAVYSMTSGSSGVGGSYTLDYSAETALQSKTLAYGTAVTYTATDGSEWVIKAYKNGTATAGLQINKGKDASIKVPDCPGAISSVVVTDATAKVLSFSATDYTGSNTPTAVATSESSTTATLDLSGKNLTTGYIYTTDGATVITKIVVNYGGGTTVYHTYPSSTPLVTPTIAFASSSQTMQLGDAAKTVTATVSGSTGAVTYTSGDTKIATVDASTGAVTPVAVGKTTITATVAAVSGESRSASTSYELNVVMPTLASIAVTTQPTKTIYWEDETFDKTGMVVTATYENGLTQTVTDYTVSATTFTIGANDVTVSYTEAGVTKTTTVSITVNERPKYTVTFNAGTGTCETASLKETAYQGGVVLPTAVSKNEDWQFAGWATTSVEETSTKPTLYAAGETYKPEGDVTLYAVYKTGEESETTVYQYTTTFTSGKEYLFVSKNTAGSAIIIDAAKLTTSGKTSVTGTAATITSVDGTMTIVSAPSTAVWTATGSTSALQLKNGDNYLKINGSGVSLTTSSADLYWNSNTGLYGKSNSGSTSYYVKINNAGTSFSISSSSNTSSRVYMYVKTQATVENATYTSNPVLRGDVNRDGVIDVSDLTALIDIVLGDTTNEKWDYNAADVYQDGQKNQTDITSLVEIILNQK